MDIEPPRTDIPVLVLYNIDPSWSLQDQQECIFSAHWLSTSLTDIGHPVHEVCVQSPELSTVLEGYGPDEFVIFNWCEELPGVSRSESRVAQILEELGYTFTGSGSRTLTISQDKAWVKRILQNSKVPIPAWKVISSTQEIDWSSFPAIVKLAYEHCSYGITRESVVQSEAELNRRIQYVLDELHQPALVEEFIDGREFHVSVIGNDSLAILPPAEIDYSAFPDIHDRICTFESNFDKDSLAYKLTQPKVPAVITEEQLRNIEGIAMDAYQVTKCRDYARMDMRMRGDSIYLLDVNPNPDISSDTSIALGAELVGLDYGCLISLFINLASQRHPIYKSSFQVSLIGENRCQEL
jgi:D-alanine-D-alanine ligase